MLALWRTVGIARTTKLLGLLALVGVVGCVNHELVPVELDRDPGGPNCYWDPINRDIDVLLVIDNSSSMAEEQARLARSFSGLVDRLEDAGANYRIGITTTDKGSPMCDAATTPEAGNLVLSSCRDRLDEFVSEDGQIDARARACEEVCDFDGAQLEIVPTATHRDWEPAPRPWIEGEPGRTNLPPGVAVADALACFAPQGIRGCGFESPLESMVLALVRAQTAGEASDGFLRPHAQLAVVFVTDEVDCSIDEQYAEVFDPEGSKVFWSDPAAPSPSSALCWNAGVSCYPGEGGGEPGTYETCVPVNKDVDGREWVEDEAAVLRPMRRYAELLDRLEQDKQRLDPRAQVMVSVIAGVGLDGAPVYADGDDPGFLAEYGVGPGCEAGDPLVDDRRAAIQAVPPVRLRELAQRRGDANLHSICAPDYEGALSGLAEAIEARIQPACFTQCVADLDPDTAILEPACEVSARRHDGVELEVPECARVDEAFVLPSETDDLCYGLRHDDPSAPLTATPLDDLSEVCVEGSYNLELEIVRRPGAAGASLAVTCELSEFPGVDCPGI